MNPLSKEERAKAIAETADEIFDFIDKIRGADDSDVFYHCAHEMAQRILEGKLQAIHAMVFRSIMVRVHQTAIDKGWWDKQYMQVNGVATSDWSSIQDANGNQMSVAEVMDVMNKRNQGEMVALMHSELSEALEGERHGNPTSDHIPMFTVMEEEMADTLIRIFDNARARGWRLFGAIVAKMAFNANRPYKHGNKKF